MKIWGMSYGLIGDLVAGLPMLTYFEKKYPGSYKYWVIEKKCAFTAPIFLNHPLIDRIKITDEWGGFGRTDQELIAECDVVASVDYTNNRHNPKDWYNYRSFVEETAILGGITDMPEMLTKQEMHPELVKWFDVGFANPVCHTYTKSNDVDLGPFENNVAIWPYGQASGTGRMPSVGWWQKLVELLLEAGHSVFQYGRSAEPALCEAPNYATFTHLSFFEQVQASLASKVVIGIDSGPMFVMGAYRHPTITLITNWLGNHHSNVLALAPVNDNGEVLYVEGGCDNVCHDDVLAAVAGV